MAEKGCVGADCYNSGSCRGVIDSYGGISGPAFRAGAGLQSCALTFACRLPCGVDDAAAPPPPADGGMDAGRLCEPGREVVCTCDGAAGTKVCAPTGMEFSACVCSEADASDGGAVTTRAEGGGCGCRIGAESARGRGWAGAVALAVALGGLRRRRVGRRIVV